MESPLKSFCIACARYAAGDRLGEVLAVAATAPYFAIYHVAVVLHSRRELHMAFVLFGLLLSAALSTGIKKALKQPRPAATCHLLGNCHKHGMPSSHSTVMAFAATTCLLIYLYRRRQRLPGRTGTRAAPCSRSAARIPRPATDGPSPVLSSAVELLQLAALLAMTALVGYGRVHLGYHSGAQVAAGLALGATCAAVWWRLTLSACERFGKQLLQLAPLRALQFTDTLRYTGPQAAEAELIAQKLHHAK